MAVDTTLEVTTKQSERRIARRSAPVYTGISLLVALAFFRAASEMGRYSTVTLLGGAAWLFVLSMIITMPLVTARFNAASLRRNE